MHCPSCGTELAPSSMFCSECGLQIAETRTLIDPTGAKEAQKRAKTYLIEAIVVTLCCCQIAGIVAIVYAALANGQANAGNLEQADRYARTARGWSIGGFAIGATICVIYLAVIVLGLATENAL